LFSDGRSAEEASRDIEPRVSLNKIRGKRESSAGGCQKHFCRASKWRERSFKAEAENALERVRKWPKAMFLN